MTNGPTPHRPPTFVVVAGTGVESLNAVRSHAVHLRTLTVPVLVSMTGVDADALGRLALELGAEAVEHGTPLRSNGVWVAPVDRHVIIRRRQLMLGPNRRANGHDDQIGRLLLSVRFEFGSRAAVLTAGPLLADDAPMLELLARRGAAVHRLDQWARRGTGTTRPASVSERSVNQAAA